MIGIPYYETSNFVFSNFSAHFVKFEGTVYPTVEHAFHAQKFADQSLRRQIRECGSLLAAWELAQKLKPQRRKDWNTIKIDTLTNIVCAKVSQRQEVYDALLASSHDEIVEMNPNDSFWGKWC